MSLSTPSKNKELRRSIKERDYAPDDENEDRDLYLKEREKELYFNSHDKGKEKDDPPIKVFLIFNKLGATANAEKLELLLNKYFTEPKWDIEFFDLIRKKSDQQIGTTIGEFKTKPINKDRLKRHLRRVVRSGEYSYVFIAGGDGTISSSISYLVNTKMPVFIIPSGTGNAIAQEFKIPTDQEEAMKLFSRSEEVFIKPIDLIKVKDKHFILHVDIGIGANIVHSTKKKSKKRFGSVVYLYSLLKSMVKTDLCVFDFTIKIDDGDPFQIKASEIVVCNCASIGFGDRITWGPDIKPDDGVLNLAVFSLGSMFDYFRVMMAITMQKSSDIVHYYKINKSIEIETERELYVQGDGDVFGATPIQAEIIKHGLYLVVPVSAESTTTGKN